MVKFFRMSNRDIHLPLMLILCILFGIIMLPICFISININLIGSNNLENEILERIKAQTQFYLSSLEDELIRIKKLQIEYLNNDELKFLLYNTSSSDPTEIEKHLNNLLNQLKILSSSSLYIKDVCVNLPGINKSVSTVNSVTIFKYEEVKTLSKLGLNSIDDFIYWDNRLFIYMPCSDNYSNKFLLYPCIIIELSMDKFKRVLLDFASTKDSGSILVNTDIPYIIANDKDIFLLNNIIELIKRNEKKSSFRIPLNKTNYLIQYEKLGLINIYLVMYVKENNAMRVINDYRNWLWVLLLMIVIIFVFFILVLQRLIQQPIKNVIKAFQKVEEGNIDIHIEYASSDEFYLLYSYFNKIIDKIRKLITSNYEQLLMTRRAQFAALQAQINPHFLYNCFYTIKRMANLEDSEGVERFSQYLHDYYQYITKNTVEDVSLYLEVQHTRNYIEIQNIRFSKMTNVLFDELPEEFANARTPRLILQPLIENCYKHGLKNIDRNGEIRVSFTKSEGSLIIIIEDNGNEISDDQIMILNKGMEQKLDDYMSETSGMQNVYKRIQLYFNNKSSFILSRSVIGGLKISITLPFNIRSSYSGKVNNIKVKT